MTYIIPTKGLFSIKLVSSVCDWISYKKNSEICYILNRLPRKSQFLAFSISEVEVYVSYIRFSIFIKYFKSFWIIWYQNLEKICIYVCMWREFHYYYSKIYLWIKICPLFILIKLTYIQFFRTLSIVLNKIENLARLH